MRALATTMFHSIVTAFLDGTIRPHRTLGILYCIKYKQPIYKRIIYYSVLGRDIHKKKKNKISTDYTHYYRMMYVMFPLVLLSLSLSSWRRGG